MTPKVLSVAEKPSIALSIATVLSGAQPDMGDSSHVVPLCDSPRCLATVVSIHNKIKRALPPPDRRNIWWLYFCNVPLICMGTAFVKLMRDPKASTICSELVMTVLFCGFIIHMVALFYVFYWHGDMPFQLIGAKAKFMTEVIPMITAATLHHLLVFNYAYLALLLGCTTYFYTFVHFFYVAYDIGGIDVLLGLVMQVIAYMLNVELLVRALALSFCLGFSIYRYVTYCVPEVPPHSKKEVEQLPC